MVKHGRFEHAEGAGYKDPDCPNCEIETLRAECARLREELARLTEIENEAAIVRDQRDRAEARAEKAEADLAEALDALAKLRPEFCSARCCPHPVLATSHHPDCQDAKDLLSRLRPPTPEGAK